MALTLPEVKEGFFHRFTHFPTVQQCFVYRNWETVPVQRLAEVLSTTPENVAAMAYDMGLEEQKVNEKWMTAGYITVIKANWHLIPYEQLCQLLGWTRDRLAYTLKEDDFLAHKLASYKPGAPTLTYRPLTASEAKATELVRRATLEARQDFEPQTLDAFDFAPMFARNIGGQAASITGPDRFDTRLVYSYCALYGDVFTGDFRQSFPPELLEAYRSVGVNGIWCQAVLYTLIPFPYMPELSEGWEARADGLRRLTEYLGEYGIRLYLYINEPRAMPVEFFRDHPELKGAERSGFASLCTSVPEIKEYLYNGAAQLVRHAPLLGGFLTITASENQTSCYSHFADGETPCPRCRKRKKAEVLAEVNTLLYRGGASVNPDFKLLAWTWAWTAEDTAAAIPLMPPEVGVMAVSERLVPKTIGGVETSVNDYSISVVGPGKYATDIWDQAKAAGHRAYAKCQFNNTWECSPVPFLPVFETVYRHITNLVKSGVGGLMLDWTLGGYPSPTFSMLKSFFLDIGHIPTLDELYDSVFPAGSVATVKEACHLFSEAFDQYPFHIGNLYSGPQNSGPASLLFETPTGLHATMTCFPYDDLTRWRAIFPEDVFENQFRLLTEKWNEGLKVLARLPGDLKQANPVLLELCDAAEGAYTLFRTEYLATRFVRIRDGSEEGDILAVIDEEKENVRRDACVAAHNPTFGYESANHYFFNRTMLYEKYVNCAYVKAYFESKK